MCATQSTLQAKLKQSPMFNLSLSSKELFHSNMLAWIAEDADTETLFVEILKLFGVEETKAQDFAEKIRKDEYMVLREYKNFDLCICEKIKTDDPEEGYKEGRILLVLENKFKSIPYKAQLLKYQGEVAKLNEEGLKALIRSKGKGGKQIRKEKLAQLMKEKNINEITPHFVLLSLTQNAYEFDFTQKTFSVNGCNWHYVSYEEYADLLFNYSSVKDFKAQVIKDYANYIKEFSSYLSQNLPKLSQNLPQPITDKEWTKTLAPNDDLKSIRMDDIWQKLIANLILIELCKEGIEEKLVTSPDQYSVGTKIENFVELQDKSVVHVGAGLSRASGLVEIKINICDNYVFGVQIQGGLYKRFLETTKGCLKEKTADKIKEDYALILQKLSSFFRLNDTALFASTSSEWKEKPGSIVTGALHPKESNTKADLQGFGGYDDTFIDQWMTISEDATVGDVIADMIEDCIEVRKLFPLVNGKFPLANGNTNP